MPNEQVVSLGRLPSLHRLRHRYVGFVRLLLRYYGTVRLPEGAHAPCAVTGLLRPFRRTVPHKGIRYRGSLWGLPVSGQRVSTRAQGLRLRGVPRRLADNVVWDVAFPLTIQGRHARGGDCTSWPLRCRSSMAGLRVPLSTLHPRGYPRRRMTRGQDGLLFLSCAALASATLCRLGPALSWCPRNYELKCWMVEHHAQENQVECSVCGRYYGAGCGPDVPHDEGQMADKPRINAGYRRTTVGVCGPRPHSRRSTTKGQSWHGEDE